jgi:putative ABC transport system permease protein
MRFWDLVRIANRNLFRNKLRTLLTVAAIFVGSFTLTMTNGVGDGMRAYVESQVKNFEGDRVLSVRRKMEEPKNPRNSAPEEYKEAKAGEQEQAFDPNTGAVTMPQMESAVHGIEGVKSITPRYGIDGEYITLDGQKKFKLDVGMVSEGMTVKTEVGNTVTGEGQIVLPINMARAFNEKISDLVGRRATIAYKDISEQIRTMDLTIAGVATKGFMTNTMAFVDASTARLIHTYQRRETGPEKFAGFSLQLSTPDPARIDAVKKTLEERGFTATTMADNQKRTYDAIGIFKVGMSLVAMIALLAASFGIINTLVIAVLERTKEIGLQKALGMSRGRIFMIFSLESILLGFWGALIGTVAGIIVGLIANRVLIAAYADSFEGFSLFAFTLPSIVFVMVLVSAIAFIAGVMPAYRASRLNPIDSLRYE